MPDWLPAGIREGRRTGDRGANIVVTGMERAPTSATWVGRTRARKRLNRDALLRRARADPRHVLLVATIGLFMAFVDDTVVTIAFPNMVRSFEHAQLSELSWVLNAYNITFAALMIPAGRLADVFGRRRAYIGGIVVFTLGSALAAVAPSLGILIAARAIQGAGAAVIVPASLAIVLEAYPPGRRTQAVGIWSAVAGLGVGIGPSIGGALVTLDDWRLIFLINLPIGILAVRLSRQVLVESRAPGRRSASDIGGGLLVALTAGALMLAIVDGPNSGWDGADVIAGAGLAALGAAVLVNRSRRRPDTVIDTDLLRIPGLKVTSAMTVVGAAGFFALGVANVLFLIDVWHYSPLKTGLAATPAPFLGAATAGSAGRLASRWDPRRVMLVGAIVWTAAPLFLLARATSHPAFLTVYLPATALAAIGIGVVFPLVSHAAVAHAPRGRFAAATALNGALRQIGGALGVAILAALLASSGRLHLVERYHPVWWFAAGCFSLCAIGSLALPRSPGAVLDDVDEPRRRSVANMPARRKSARPSASQPPVPAASSHTDQALLGEVQMFSALSPAALRALASRSKTTYIAGGEWLFSQGDPADAAYVVRSGRLEVLRKDGSGPVEKVDELGRGSIVGELALLSGGTRAASIRCKRDAKLMRIDRQAFETTISDADAAAGVMQALAARLQRTTSLDAAQSRIATIAVVRRFEDERAATVEEELLTGLEQLCDIATLDQSTVRDAAHGDPIGVGLAQVLDRVEPHHDLVVLRAAAAQGGEWLECCVQQADRVVLMVDRGTAEHRSRLGGARLAGCDAVLLESAEHPNVAPLLDDLGPRSTQRIRGSADVARLARRLAGRAVGLVLSGGGARAFAHIGVFEELEAAGIVIDRIAGASMGAFVGAMLASEMDGDEALARCYLEFVRRNPLNDYRFPNTSLIRGARFRAMVERNLPGLIEDTPRCYFCVTADIISGQMVVHRRGELATAVRAAMSLPGFTPPVPLGQRLLVDGGILDNLPVTTMAAECEGPIIASNAGKAEQRKLAPGEAPPRPGLVDTLFRVMFLGTADIEALAQHHAELTISPERDFVNWNEFHMIDKMRDSGRRAALEALESAPASLLGAPRLAALSP